MGCFKTLKLSVIIVKSVRPSVCPGKNYLNEREIFRLIEQEKKKREEEKREKEKKRKREKEKKRKREKENIFYHALKLKVCLLQLSSPSVSPLLRPYVREKII